MKTPTNKTEACEVLYWSMRGLLSRAWFQQLDSDVVATLTLEVVGEWLTAQGLSIVDEHLNIVEVL